jgi:polysaccharide biosynthesis protein PslJ
MRLSTELKENMVLRQVGIVLLAVGLGAVSGLAIVAGNPIVPFVAVVAFVALPWLITRPMADIMLVVGTITLLPFAAAPVRLAVFTPTLLEVGLILLYVAWFLRSLVGSGTQDKEATGVARTPLDVWLLLFLGATAFAFVLGMARDASTDVAHNYVKLVLSVGIFFAASNLLRSANAIALTLKALIITGGIAAGLGVFLWRLPDILAVSLLSRLSVIGYPTDRVVRYIEDNPLLGERAVGTQVDPNSFGGLLVVIAVLTGVALLARKPLLPRWLLGGLFLLDITALVLTNSRSALLGVVAAGVLVATMRYRRLWGWGLAFGAVLLVGGLGTGYFARLLLGLQFQDQASLMRLAEYQNALDIIGRYPVFGVGFGTAGELDLTTGVSSVYLTIGERAGLITLALFVVLAIVFFVSAIPSIPQSLRRAAPWAGSQAEWSALDVALLGGTASILGALLVGLVDHFYFNIEFPHMAALFWLTVALTMCARRLLAEGSEIEPSWTFQGNNNEG